MKDEQESQNSKINKLKKICKQFGVTDIHLEFKRDCIILPTGKEDFFIILNSEMEIVDIGKCPRAYLDAHVSHALLVYNDYTDLYPAPYGKKNGFPFEEFTLKQIVDISKNISQETLHTRCSQKDNLIERQLLSYLQFLTAEISFYHTSTYPLKMLGFDVPDIYSYLRGVMTEVASYVDEKCASLEALRPDEILNRLGQTEEQVHVTPFLEDVIDFHCLSNGCRVCEEGYPEWGVTPYSSLAIKRGKENLLSLLTSSEMDEEKKNSGLSYKKRLDFPKKAI